MELDAKLSALVELAEASGIGIRHVPSAGRSPQTAGGALVRLAGKDIIFLDPTASQLEQIAVLADALRGRDDVAGKFILPEIREIIDQAGRDQ